MFYRHLDMISLYIMFHGYGMLPKTYPTTNARLALMLNERSLIERLKMFACGWMFRAPRCSVLWISVCWRVTDETCIEMNTPWIILGYFPASCFSPTGLLCWQQTSIISNFHIFQNLPKKYELKELMKHTIVRHRGCFFTFRSVGSKGWPCLWPCARYILSKITTAEYWIWNRRWVKESPG